MGLGYFGICGGDHWVVVEIGFWWVMGFVSCGAYVGFWGLFEGDGSGLFH